MTYISNLVGIVIGCFLVATIGSVASVALLILGVAYIPIELIITLFYYVGTGKIYYKEHNNPFFKVLDICYGADLGDN